VLPAVIEAVLGFALEFLFARLWWILLFPVVWLVSLPFILVIALFWRVRYSFAVIEMLTSVHCFWKEWGIMIVE
jgi:hypothetical protein